MATQEPLIEKVFDKLGGRNVLGTQVFSDADLARVVHHRIRLKALTHLIRAGFSKQEIHTFIIPARTLRHRQTRKEPLTIEESDRAVKTHAERKALFVKVPADYHVIAAIFQSQHQVLQHRSPPTTAGNRPTAARYGMVM